MFGQVRPRPFVVRTFRGGALVPILIIEFLFFFWCLHTIGEAVIMTRSGMSRRQVAPAAVFAPDIFEYVYLARPDSVIDGISVYRSRMAMGNALAREVQRVLTEKGISVDVVIPVPDTSRVAALNLAQALGLPYREGFVKNWYMGHTFMLPDQQMWYIACYCGLGMAFYAT